MAYSPTPGASNQPRRQSVSPPFLTKRDKRRNAMEARIKEMSTTFTSHREAYSRAQLNSIIRDINYITHADPYDLKPLEDYPDELGNELTAYGGEQTVSRGGTVGHSEADARPALGKWAATFVDSVNDAMELRDTEVTEVMNRFQDKVRALQEEHAFALSLAQEEHKSMKRAILDRAVAHVHSKKRALEKEKGLLDIADSNTLLLHPNQFTITQPASPSNGAAGSHRRTRLTRHRLDLGDTTDTHTNGEGGHKRKRKAPADYDNLSPGPAGRGSITIDADALYYYDRNFEQSVTINTLFTQKDLQHHLRSAIETVGQSWSKRSRSFPSHLNPSTSPTNGTLILEGPLISDDPLSLDGPSEHLGLTAPAMERGGSYATRSTRKDDSTALQQFHEAFDGDQRMALQDFGLVAVGAHLKFAKTKEDQIPMTGGLTAQEIAEDLAVFETLRSGVRA